LRAGVSKWFRSYGFADVAPDLAIGAYPLDDEDVRALEFIGVQRVLNLVADEEYAPGTRDLVKLAFADAGIEEQRVRVKDFGHLPPDTLEEAVAVVNGWLDDGLQTYVHCRAGWQRSAAVAAGVVATRDGIDVDDAVRKIRRRKPTADPLPHQREDLRRWWRRRRATMGDDRPQH
jgi:protein-tyrosine phosphatase